MGFFLKIIGFATIWKWVGSKGKWKAPEIQLTTQTDNKNNYKTIQWGFNEWIGYWRQIIEWSKFLRISQQIFCLQTCITLPIGCLVTKWSFGIFGIFLVITYLIYYKYCFHSKQLIAHQTKAQKDIYLQECKSTVKTAVFLNFFPFICLFGYKPFRPLIDSLSFVIDIETLYRMNPNLLKEKLQKLNKNPMELNGYQVKLEEFQQPPNVL